MTTGGEFREVREVSEVEERIRRGAETAISQTLKAGAETYERARDLPGLARILPGEIASDSRDGLALILSRLEGALRAERHRAPSGHWTYDLNRHIALRQAYLAERRRLDVLMEKRRES
jgi:hypothetical protein